MTTRDPCNASVNDCLNAARSPFSLLADAYGRADLHARHRQTRRGRVGEDLDRRTPTAGWPRMPQFRLPSFAAGHHAALASILVLLALAGGVLAGLPF